MNMAMMNPQKFAERHIPRYADGMNISNFSTVVEDALHVGFSLSAEISATAFGVSVQRIANILSANKTDVNGVFQVRAGKYRLLCKWVKAYSKMECHKILAVLKFAAM